MRVISLTGAESYKHPVTGETFESGPDGVFDLPQEYGLELTRKHAAQWRSEVAQQAADRRKNLAKLRNPTEVASTVTTLIARVDALEAQAREHRAQIEDLKAAGAKAPRAAKRTAAGPAE
jgi:outer membrane murein-binding lipoprotein Lpp